MSRNLLKEITNADDDFIQNTLNNMDAEQFKEFCRMGILQQDRDTRHACANKITENRFGSHMNEYHNIVMNCRDGVK